LAYGNFVSATTIPLTEFAPAERVPIAIVQQQAAALEKLPLSPQILNSVLNCVLILNPQRQIVFASENLKLLLTGKTTQEIIGMRPGEALGCVHADEHVNGCGTSQFCAECGAVKAILASLDGRHDMQECRLLRLVNGVPEALDLLVYASPLKHNGHTYSLFCVSDISHQMRRRAMERLFFHDLLNSMGGLAGLMDQLKQAAPSNLRADLELAATAFEDAIEQILAQKELAAAEGQELAISPVPLNAVLLLHQVVDLFARHPMANQRRLVLGPCPPAATLCTDATLFKRVMGNLIKNALEDSAPGEAVTVGCSADGARFRFTVHNPGVMPLPVQRQIFHRSFTTKGEGRGLGTYSVKLLTEKYLKGTVGFTSSEEAGTTFFVLLPKTI
jgi:nitrogen-specific signal transduction histidine kinase